MQHQSVDGIGKHRRAGEPLRRPVLFAAVVSRLRQALVYGVRMSDATAYVASIGILLAAVGVASIGPGWRAISVDPIEALRE